jgi:hypothetical protein
MTQPFAVGVVLVVGEVAGVEGGADVVKDEVG